MKIVDYLKNNIWLVGILVLASILRFFHLSHESAWADEISTLSVTNPNDSFYTVINNVNLKEGFPYIYFLMMKVFNSISYSVLTPRLFSAILGIASVYWIYKLGKILFSSNAGHIAAFILAINQFAILTSQEARPYSLYMLFVIVSFYYLVSFIKIPTTKNAVLYGLAAGLLLNTSFYGILNVGSQGLILIFYWFLVDKANKFKYLKDLILAAIIILLFFIPNYFKLQTLLGFASGWIPEPNNDSLGAIFRELMGKSEILSLLFLVFTIFFFVKLFQEEVKTKYNDLIDNKIVFGFVILFSWTIVFLSVMYVKSYLDTSILLHRYFISLLPMIILLIAASISFISNKAVMIASVATVGLFMLINLIVVHKYYQNLRNTQYEELTDFAIVNNTEKDVIYTNLSIWLNTLASVQGKDIQLTQIESFDAIIMEMKSDPSKLISFWFLNADMGDLVITPETQTFIDENFVIIKNFDGRNVYARYFKLK